MTKREKAIELGRALTLAQRWMKRSQDHGCDRFRSTARLYNAIRKCEEDAPETLKAYLVAARERINACRIEAFAKEIEIREEITALLFMNGRVPRG